jgi:formate hydrogenlyase subunit 6/NADH:ubiquinone oxidoreductase subunit I
MTVADFGLADELTIAPGSPWSDFGTSAARRLMLDPEHCINCGECEQACPWEAVYSIEGDRTAPAVDRDVSVFIVEDHNCTRCGVCVQACPTFSLYFALLGDEAGTTRTMGVVAQQGVVA